MKKYVDKFQKLPPTSRLSLFVAALLLFAIGITVNDAMTRQEERTRATSNNTPAASNCNTKPALGNFQKSNNTTQNNSAITYDAFTDARVNTLHRSSPVQTILEFYSTTWSWAPDKLRARFQLAKNYANKTDYISFLMEEELIQPNLSSWYSGWRPGFVGAPGFTSSYGVQNFEGVSVNYGAGSATFYLQLLKAWKQLCVNLVKKCAMLGDAQSATSFYNSMYGSAGVDYIAHNYDMIFLYAYPKTVSQAGCGSGWVCAKTKIDYWRSKGFTGKINYILTTEQFGAGSDAVVEADFKNAADAGADIISAYPYKHSSDTLATTRMIQIWNKYTPSSSPCSNPSPTQKLTQAPPTITQTPNTTGTPIPTQNPNTTPLPSPTPTPIYVTPTIYCLGSCLTPSIENPTNQPPSSQPPNPTAPPNPTTPTTSITIIVVIIILLLLLRLFGLRYKNPI